MLILCIGVLLVKVIYYFSWIIFPQSIQTFKMVKYFTYKKCLSPLKKRQITRRVKTAPKCFSFPQRGWSGSKGITGLSKAIKKPDLKSDVVWPWVMSQVVLKTKVCVLGKFSWFLVRLLKSFNLGNVNMGFIPCIYIYINLYLSLHVSTHTCFCFRK